jgi:nitrogen fixation NifU-like protein
MYSEQVKKLVAELPNRGELADATHGSVVENPVCGDLIQLFFKIEQGIVMDCRFLAAGCPGAISSAAAVTMMCRSKTLDDCRALRSEDLLIFLGGLPRHRVHGAELALEGVHQALAEAP